MFLKKKKNPVLNSTWYFCDKLQFSPTIMTWYLLVSLVGTFLLYLKLSGKSDYGCFVPHLKFRNLEYSLIALKKNHTFTITVFNKLLYHVKMSREYSPLKHYISIIGQIDKSNYRLQQSNIEYSNIFRQSRSSRKLHGNV